MHRLGRILWNMIRPRSKWGWIVRGGIFFAIFNVITVEMTSQSWFCNSCHIMGPYYASWKHGSHQHVECVRCHIPPGVQNFVFAKLNGAGQVVDDLLSRTSTKPSADVPDQSCTRTGCHDMEKVRTIARRTGRFFFDHGKHLGREYKGIEIHCTTCHSHVKGDKHFEVNTNACITCHLVKLPGGPKAQLASVEPSAAAMVPHEAGPPGQCRTCHEPPAKAIDYRGLKVVHAEYVAYGAQCESCHSGVTEKAHAVRDDQCFSCHEFGAEKITSVEETHRVHSSGKHKVECFSCHGVTRHGPAAQSMRLDQIECQSCHQGQHAIQQKTYKTVSADPHGVASAGAVSPMFMVHVNCTGCHTEQRPLSAKPGTGATVARPTAAACGACHQAGLGEKMVPLWQKNTHELFDAVSKMVPPASAALSAEDAQRVNEAKGLLDLVRLDGSWGVHNPRYTQKLLEDAQKKLASVQPSKTDK